MNLPKSYRILHPPLRLLGVMLLALLVAGPALAFPRPTLYGQIATTEVSGSKIFWDRITIEYERLTVNVTAPCGDFSQVFDSRDTPFFDTAQLGSMADGSYTYELVAEAIIDPAVKKALEKVRGTPEEQEVLQELWDKGLLPRGPFRQAGFFEVVEGRVLPPNTQEETNPKSLAPTTSLEARTPGSVGSTAASSEDGPLRNAAAAGSILTNSDGIIRNSLCVGFDCPTSPTFSDTTILLMENNTRIKFDDTSTISGFPNRDWELQANSNSSGGGSYFAINDCASSSQGGCAEDPVFIVEANAPANSIRVDSGGRVGLGTSNPVVELHIVDGDTPTLRLDQASSSGFAPQIWDVAGNETTFFVRDVTNGSQLPFRIQPGADSNSLYITSDNNVGMGTSSPDSRLQVVRTASGNAELLKLTNNGPIDFVLDRTDISNSDWRFEAENVGFFISRIGSGSTEFQLSNAGSITIPGTITTSGSCSLGCDRVFEPGYDVESIEQHAASMWIDRHLPAVGPTPENGPFNLTEKTGGMLNELEIAHIYIAQINDALKEKDAQLQDVTARLARLEALVEQPKTQP